MTSLTSLYADVQIHTGSLFNYVSANWEQYGDVIAIVDEDDRKLSYSALFNEVERCAKALHDRGVKKGDMCLIQSPNTIAYVITFFALLRLGAVTTTMNPAYTGNELGHQLKDSKASWVFCSGEQLPVVREVRDDQDIFFHQVFVWDSHLLPENDSLRNGETLFNNVMAEATEAAPPTQISGDEIAALPYSSGTTGLSKGVMLSHNNIVANLCQMQALLQYRVGDRVLSALPLYHIYGLVVVMSLTLRMGATMILMRRFDFANFLKLTQAHRIQWLPIVPPVMVGLAKHPAVDKFDLSSVHTIICGAAPLSGEVAQQVFARFSSVDIRQGYGMTELSPVTHMSPPNNTKYSSAGVMLPNTLAKIVNSETGAVITKCHERGELWIKGPQVMMGYLNNEEATRNTVDKDGYLHTGDVVEMDEEGFYCVVDRIKELIKYKGFQVPPAELEGILLLHDDIADCAVVPIPDGTSGELPKAFVVLKPGRQLSEEAVKDWVKAKVVYYKQLRGGVEFVDSIPKSASGKILRRVLKQKEAQKTTKKRVSFAQETKEEDGFSTFLMSGVAVAAVVVGFYLRFRR